MSADKPARVLLFSDDRSTRDVIRTAVGRRASYDTPMIEWHEVATPDAVVLDVEADPSRFDLLILDAEAPKHGGMGLARTLKSEIFGLPPVLLLIAREQDQWLASWSEAEAVVPAPYEPVRLQEAVAGLLRAER